MVNCPYRVTICSPIYGVEKYIERCAKSLFEQTYSDIDYVFVNDCTKDKSIIILNKVIDLYPERKGDIRIINHEKNRGLSAARNTGIDNVKTEYLIWVDSDDYIEKDFIEALVRMQILTGADIVCGGVKSVYNNHVNIETRNVNMTKTDYLHSLLAYRTEHWIWGKLIKTDLYNNNNVNNIEGINMAEDYQTLPLLVYFAKSISFVDQPYYHYNRINENSLTSGFSEERQRESFNSLLYIRNKFVDTEFEKDVNRYLLILFYEQMKPFIRGAKITNDHIVYYKNNLKMIPLRTYLSLSIKIVITILYAWLFVLKQ